MTKNNALTWWDFANHFYRGMRLSGLRPLYERSESEDEALDFGFQIVEPPEGDTHD